MIPEERENRRLRSFSGEKRPLAFSQAEPPVSQGRMLRRQYPLDGVVPRLQLVHVASGVRSKLASSPQNDDLQLKHTHTVAKNLRSTFSCRM
jgi:hypothetical protein